MQNLTIENQKTSQKGNLHIWEHLLSKYKGMLKKIINSKFEWDYLGNERGTRVSVERGHWISVVYEWRGSAGNNGDINNNGCLMWF